MATEAAWGAVVGKLSVATGDEFERTALHYLRVFWPDLIQAPRLQALDRCGVDLCVVSSSSHYQVVVQAKGFKIAEELLDDQVERQVLPSIRKFLESSLTCDEYVLLHNRQGSDRAAAAKIESALAGLVATGKARSARLWDRDKFVKDVRGQLNQRIRRKLEERSATYLDRHERFFHFGHELVPMVPLRKFTWQLGSTSRDAFDNGQFVVADAAKIIASPRHARYALLIGSFGIGKTITALRAASSKGLIVVYVPAHTILRNYGSQGTNFLLRNVNEELNLLEDLPADTAEVLNDLMGAALGRVLRQPEDKFVLVIDGLDEHRFYGSAEGLQWLTNELAELRCSIVLSTRSEHVKAMIGNYDIAMQELSRKGGAKRVVEVFELGAWSAVQAEQLLHKALASTNSREQAKSINFLLNEVALGSSSAVGNMLSHPLFLQMTLDLIVDGNQRLIEDTDELIDSWVRKKIERDLLTPRLRESVTIDADQFVACMVDAMTKVAAAINRDNPESETIDVQNALTIAREALDLPDLGVSTLLTTSLLVPVSVRRGRELRVKFFHKVLYDRFARRV